MENETKRYIRIAGCVLFALYLVLLVYLLFFAERYGRSDVSGYRLNLQPLREIRRFLGSRGELGEGIVFLNVYGNVLLFIPFGAIMPVISRRLRSLPAVTAAGIAFSVCVEAAQLVSRRGSCDVDDILLNTLGVMTGYAVFALGRAVWLRRSGWQGK